MQYHSCGRERTGGYIRKGIRNGARVRIFLSLLRPRSSPSFVPNSVGFLEDLLWSACCCCRVVMWGVSGKLGSQAPWRPTGGSFFVTSDECGPLPLGWRNIPSLLGSGSMLGLRLYGPQSNCSDSDQAENIFDFSLSDTEEKESTRPRKIQSRLTRDALDHELGL